MKLIRSLFLNGLAVVLPTAGTLYLLWWIGNQAESLLGGLFQLWLPEGWYLPGMGVVAGLLLVFAIGLLTKLWLTRELIGVGERLLARIPLVKTVFTPLKDMMGMFTKDHTNQLSRVVRYHFGDSQLIGFVTKSQVQMTATDQPMAAVYFPMSYQIGGYTLLLPEDKLEQLDMTVEEGMRFVLTAGMAQGAESQS